MTELMA